MTGFARQVTHTAEAKRYELVVVGDQAYIGLANGRHIALNGQVGSGQATAPSAPPAPGGGSGGGTGQNLTNTDQLPEGAVNLYYTLERGAMIPQYAADPDPVMNGMMFINTTTHTVKLGYRDTWYVLHTLISDFLTLEDGTYLLLENGEKLLLETA